MRNLRLVVSYVGTRYAGWQVQPERPTIQGLLEDRLTRMLRHPVRLAGAGRTDSGVHARGQVANFTTDVDIPEEGLLRGLNSRLPIDVAVLRVDHVADAFHARSSARAKEYRYRISRARVVSPFIAPFVAPVRTRLDVGAMQDTARCFAGTHDFTSFCPADVEIEDRVRTLTLSEVSEADEEIHYRVIGDGFLRHMVRTLSGTLILAGQGRLRPDDVPAILEARDRRRAGPTAPARGLILEAVDYGEGR